MKRNFCQFCFLLLHFVVFAQEYISNSDKRVTSIIDSTIVDNLILEQSFIVNVPLDSVWSAYTSKEGWESWAVAKAEIDFKINGLIQTSYDKNANIGDPGTIKLHVINFIPKRMITLQAELTNNFPEFMQEDEKNLFNMILFEELEANKTKVISYGIGYKNNEKYMSLMKFFIQGNEQSYLNLISYLETGERSVKY